MQVQIADFATAMPHVKARAVAFTMANRSSLVPGLPTIDEVLKGFDISAWNGLFAAGRTPAATATRIADAWTGALAVPEVREKLAGIGFDVSQLGPAAFAAYVKAEIASWRRLAQEAGVKPE